MEKNVIVDGGIQKDKEEGVEWERGKSWEAAGWSKLALYERTPDRTTKTVGRTDGRRFYR